MKRAADTSRNRGTLPRPAPAARWFNRIFKILPQLFPNPNGVNFQGSTHRPTAFREIIF
jgi:hypothetical protein